MSKITDYIDNMKNSDLFNRYTDVSPLKLYIGAYKNIPNIYTITFNVDDNTLLKYIENIYSKNEEYYYFYNFIDEYNDNDEIENKKFSVWVLDEQLMLTYENKKICLYHRYNDEWCDKFIENLVDNCGLIDDLSYNFNIITKNNNYFELKRIKPVIQNTDISLMYNDDFKNVDSKINTFLNSSESGVIILHGRQGTGKTSYIRHLISNSKDKKIIYLTTDMMEYLSSPDIIPFMLKHTNSILILEDCEELLRSRKGSTKINNGLINILNMSDGLLGDALHIKFICTFNDDLKEIDSALQRKGRLVARYEFKALNKEKVKILNEKFNLNIPDVNIDDMTLADIFNFYETDYTKHNNKIGLL